MFFIVHVFLCFPVVLHFSIFQFFQFVYLLFCFFICFRIFQVFCHFCHFSLLVETHYCHLAHFTQDLTTTPHDSTAARTEFALWRLITQDESSPWMSHHLSGSRQDTRYAGVVRRETVVARLTRTQHATKVVSTTRCIKVVAERNAATTTTHVSLDLVVFVHQQLTHWMDWTRISWPLWRTGLVRQESFGKFEEFRASHTLQGVNVSFFCLTCFGERRCSWRSLRMKVCWAFRVLLTSLASKLQSQWEEELTIHTCCRQWHDIARCTYRHSCFQSFCLDVV